MSKTNQNPLSIIKITTTLTKPKPHTPKCALTLTTRQSLVSNYLTRQSFASNSHMPNKDYNFTLFIGTTTPTYFFSYQCENTTFNRINAPPFILLVDVGFQNH